MIAREKLVQGSQPERPGGHAAPARAVAPDPSGSGEAWPVIGRAAGLMRIALSDENRDRLAIASRFGAPILGGFAFTYGFVALATVAGFALGLRFFESWSLANLLSFLVYLVVLLWGFAARSVGRVWLVLGVGGVAMSVAAWALSGTMT